MFKTTFPRAALLAICFLCASVAWGQLSVAVEGGFSRSMFGIQPVDLNRVDRPGLTDELVPVSRPYAGLHVEYTPEDSRLTFAASAHFNRRGYEHIVTETIEGQTFVAVRATGLVDFADLLLSAGFRVGRHLHLRAGPYASVAIAERSGPDRISMRGGNDRDYGLHGGMVLRINRIYFVASYQQSLRAFDYSAYHAANGQLESRLDRDAKVNLVTVGLGYLLIK